jgi:hypothetical protein
MTPRLPAALTPADLPLAELTCARLDGELFSLAGVWCPVDAHDGPETRARALAPIAPSRAAAERMTAAWIYGLSAEPGHHQFCVDVTARTRKPADGTAQLREVRLDRDDTITLGRQLVTTPLRTALDLARWGRSPGRPADIDLLAALLAYDGPNGAPPDTQALARHRGISFSRVAAARLHQAHLLNLSR